MKSELFFHLLFIGIWLGCVAVEAVIEWMGRSSAEAEAAVARFHYRIDLFVEIPAFSAVLLTGLLMLDLGRMSGAYALTVVTGALVVLVNALCVIPVVRRKRYADANEPARVRRESGLIFLALAIGLPLGGVAMVTGMRMLGIL